MVKEEIATSKFEAVIGLRAEWRTPKSKLRTFKLRWPYTAGAITGGAMS
jgi:hypothetical protein